MSNLKEKSTRFKTWLKLEIDDNKFMRSEATDIHTLTKEKAVQTNPSLLSDFFATYSLKRLIRFSAPSRGLQDHQVMNHALLNKKNSELAVESGNFTQLSPAQRRELLNTHLDAFIDAFFGLGCPLRPIPATLWSPLSNDSAFQLPDGLPAPAADFCLSHDDASDPEVANLLRFVSSCGTTAALLTLLSRCIEQRQIFTSCWTLSSCSAIEQAQRFISTSWLCLGFFVHLAEKMADTRTFEQLLALIVRLLDPLVFARPLRVCWSDSSAATLCLKGGTPLPFGAILVQLGAATPVERLARLIFSAALDFLEVVAGNPYVSTFAFTHKPL